VRELTRSFLLLALLCACVDAFSLATRPAGKAAESAMVGVGVSVARLQSRMSRSYTVTARRSTLSKRPAGVAFEMLAVAAARSVVADKKLRARQEVSALAGK